MGTPAIILASLHGAHLLAVALLVGTLASLTLVAPAGLREAGGSGTSARRTLVGLARWSDVLALLIGIGWLYAASATIAGTGTIGDTLAAMVTVGRDTRFGHVVVLRFVLLLFALPLLGARDWRLWVALLLSSAALAIQGGMGHAGATGGTAGGVLLVSEGLHLLAAGAWLGGLLPLFLLVRSLPPRAAAATCEKFTPVGLCAVLLIACTAVVQALQLIGGLGALVGTTYGRLALLKLGIFLLLLVLAIVNRVVLTGRLHDTTRPVTANLLRTSIATEIALGILVIMVAAFLASNMPATDETPIWPFSRRPSVESLYDSAGRVQLTHVALPSAIAIVMVLIGRLWRFLFWPALAALAITLVFLVPNLALLLSTTAYRTTLATSPTEFADSSIIHGAALFAANCTKCHGVDGRGGGPAAKSLPVSFADLTGPHFWSHTDGDLYWFISHGIDAPSGVTAMPPFGGTLSSDKIWALIDYLRAYNAGYGMGTGERWDHPTPLPKFDAVCADGSAIDPDDLRNRVVHVIAAIKTVVPPPPPVGISVATVVLTRDHKVKPTGSACVTVAPTTWDAFAILMGEPSDALVGFQALADENGWLRRRWHPGDTPSWTDPQVLDAAIRRLAAHPLAIGAEGGRAHQH